MMVMRVVKIISDRQIVLNVGSENAVQVGDIFHIIDKNGEPIIDPETGEYLGNLDLPKATIIVEYVYPKMCICGNNEIIEEQNPFANPFELENHVYRPPLKVNLDEVSGGFDINLLSPIQIGDIAYKD